MTLGFYENFPENIHHIALFATPASNRRAQQALLETFKRLNTDRFILETVSNPSTPNCTTEFEFGMAEGGSFIYLDAEETERILKALSKQPFRVMDFMCVACYRRMEGNRKIPMRFDYFMLRFAFEEHQVEMQVFHQKGPRHMAPEDLVKLITSRVNGASARIPFLKPIEL